MKQSKNSLGFSMIEMALSTFMVVSISAVTYQVLKNQTNQQMVSMENQKNNRSSQVAMARFKSDANMIDPNWVRYGVAPIYPHQGYGIGQNYYLLSSTQQAAANSINDGVTFLRRNPQSDRLYVPATTSKRFCYPTALITSEDQLLFNTNVALDSIDGLAVGDWMLVYQAGNYALGIITQATAQTGAALDSASSRFKSSNLSAQSSSISSSKGFIRLRMPNANELQTTASTFNGKSTGFVTKAGVVAASYDYTGNLTSDSNDNSFCFEATKASFQKMASPVSYFVDYRTTDGLTKAANNSYLLDKKRNEKIKMLVRAEYVNGVQKREYIAPVDEVGFTYDLLNEGVSSGADRIARNVGRAKTSEHLLNLAVSNPSQSTTNFLTSYRIVSMKMGINAIVKDPEKTEDDWKQFNTIKVALDPSLQDDAYRDEATVVSSLTDYLNTLPQSSTGVTNEQVGKPLYLLNGSKPNEVVLPVSTFEVLADGDMGAQSKGGLYVYDTDGCAVNGDNCNPTNNSAIQFTLGGSGRFFPNSISQIDLADGSRRVVVGGVAMGNGAAGIERKPALGIITLGAGETLKDKLTAGGGTSTCNVDNCNIVPIASASGIEDLVDTAHLSVDPANPNDLYIATMTKKIGETSKSSVYKATWNGSGYTYAKYATVEGTEQGKLISAISDRPISIAGKKYIAVCMTKQMSASCEGECINKYDPLPPKVTVDPSTGAVIGTDNMSKLGEIQLVTQDNGATDRGITILKHNYRCSSMNVDENQNIIVSGRLTSQPISYQSIKQTVLNRNSSVQRNVMYLDEAVAISGATTVYADYYRVDPSTYLEGQKPQFIGWLTGMSAVEFPDGTFGMVNANKIRKQSGVVTCDPAKDRNCNADDGKVTQDTGKTLGKGETTGAVYTEYSNAGISKVQLAGMNDRVVATIETDPNNINNSIISATYSVRSSELPGVYIPGDFYVTPGQPRTTPTPLPSVSPAMSEKSWFQLYQALLTPRDDSGLNSNMPVYSDQLQRATVCDATIPKTCG